MDIKRRVRVTKEMSIICIILQWPKELEFGPGKVGKRCKRQNWKEEWKWVTLRYLSLWRNSSESAPSLRFLLEVASRPSLLFV